MDNIANLLTIIRNAQKAKHETAKAPYSRVNFGVGQILKRDGWIKDIEEKKRGNKSWLVVTLKYGEDGLARIRELKRISKPGRRMYVNASSIPLVVQGYGEVILSTPRGILNGKEAKKQKVGGEVICRVL